MPDYTITLTPEQDAALDVLLSRLNGPKDKAAYIQERAAGVADNYVVQVTAEETEMVADAWKRADPTQKDSVKSALGIGG